MNYQHGQCTGGRVTPEVKAWYEMKARCGMNIHRLSPREIKPEDVSG